MGITTALRRLFVPHKDMAQIRQPNYGIDMRAIEQWAQQAVVQLLAGSGITLSPANGQGPVVTISSTGGGGGTISDITSGFVPPTIRITNPGGPTVTIDVNGPYLTQTSIYNDINGNMAYGGHALNDGINSGFVGGNTGNTAIGLSALQHIGTGSIGNTVLGYAVGQTISTSGSASYNVIIGYLANASGAGLTGNDNVIIGRAAGSVATSGAENVMIGSFAGNQITTGQDNTIIGASAGVSLINGTGNTFLGEGAGSNVSVPTAITNTTCLGAATWAQANGGVAIGIDHLSNSAFAANVDDFVLGTNHHVIVFQNHTTGTGTAGLGTNCPATTPGSPQGWIVIRDAASGQLGYIPFWR